MLSTLRFGHPFRAAIIENRDPVKMHDLAREYVSLSLYTNSIFIFFNFDLSKSLLNYSLLSMFIKLIVC